MSRPLLPLGVATFVGVSILLGLGVWQWRRMAEKEALIATIAARTNLPSEPFPNAPFDAAAYEYRPVTLAGVFDHDREAHVFFSLSRPVGGVSGPGYLIVTPLRLDDGRSVLVNRGFVPAERKLAATRAAGQIAGRVAVVGLVRLPEARNAFSGADDAARNVFYVRDPVAIAATKGVAAVAPVLVDLRTPAPPGGLPVPAVTQTAIPNNHFQYALTWWSLAAVLAAIASIFARQQRA